VNTTNEGIEHTDAVFLGSVGNLNRFADSNSPTRGHMASLHKKTSVGINKPERCLVTNGYETEMLEGNMHKFLPAGSRVLDIITYRIGKTLIETSVLYFNPEEKNLSIEVIPEFEQASKEFGHRHRHTELMDKMSPGDVVRKFGKLTSTNSEVDGEHAYGINAKVAWIPDPRSAEDGVLISETMSRKSRFDIYEVMNITIKSDMVPMNTQGTIDDYKVMPDVGDKIGDDGIVMALRKYEDATFLTRFTRKRLMEPQQDFDDIYRVKAPGFEVVRIDVIHGGKKKGKGFTGTSRQIEYYNTTRTRYLENVIASAKDLFEKYDNIEISNELHTFIISNTLGTDEYVNKEWSKDPVGIWRIQITLRKTEYPFIKSKLATRHGTKGIVVNVVPDHLMPIDVNGTRADVVMSGISTERRLNYGNSYEGYVHTAVDIFNRDLIEMMRNGEETEAIRHTKGFLSLFNNIHRELFDEATREEQLEAIRDGIRPLSTAMDNQTSLELCVAIRLSPYAPKMGKLTVYNEKGEPELTKSDNLILNNYMLVLYKIANKWLAAGSVRTNVMGVAVSASKQQKAMLPYNAGATKNFSIIEGRMYPAMMGMEPVAELRDRTNNPIAHRELYKNILYAEDPMRIQRLVDRDDEKFHFGNDVSRVILDALLKTGGSKLIYKDMNRGGN